MKILNSEHAGHTEKTLCVSDRAPTGKHGTPIEAPGHFRCLDGIAASGCAVVFPVHPRTRVKLDQMCRNVSTNLRFIDPVLYLDMLKLKQNARVILTDSGGVQREAFWLGVLCVTLRHETEWLETVNSGRNRLAGTDPARIAAALEEHWPSAAGLNDAVAIGAAELNKWLA